MNTLANPSPASMGTVTGVDNNKNRMLVCQSLLRRWKNPLVRLFLSDAREFECLTPIFHASKITIPPSLRSHSVPESALSASSTPVVKTNPSPFYARKLLRSVDSSLHNLYDKVLVDVECTHDGSIAHIVKYFPHFIFPSSFLHQSQLDALESLQRSLLLQAFKLVKVGGTLVYSTCSFSRRQNENVVEWLLETEIKAKLLPISSPIVPLNDKWKMADEDDYISRSTMRFWGWYVQSKEGTDKEIWWTSGLFIAKITKTCWWHWHGLYLIVLQLPASFLACGNWTAANSFNHSWMGKTPRIRCDCDFTL